MKQILAVVVISVLAAPAAAGPAMFSRDATDAYVATLPSPPLVGLTPAQFARLLEEKPDKVRFDNLAQGLAYFNVLKGEGISKTFYDTMALAGSHLVDIGTTKVRLDAVDEEGNPKFKETNFVFQDVEGLIILKTAMTISAALASALRNRPSIEYHADGGVTVTRGKGSGWATWIAVGINLSAAVWNLTLR